MCINCRAAMNADIPPGEVPLPSSPAVMGTGGSSALDEAMAKTLAAIDPSLANAIPIPEESKYNFFRTWNFMGLVNFMIVHSYQHILQIQKGNLY